MTEDSRVINAVSELMVIVIGAIVSGPNWKGRMISYVGDDQERFWGPKMNVTVAISHFLITFNCSSNFIIYCAKVKLANLYF